MPIAEDDWRLRGQEDLLAGRTFRWSRWWSERERWDHDHCEFCWAEISTLVGDHADAEEGWVTADDDELWVCDTCFADFRERFRWTVSASGTQDGETSP